MDQESVRSQMKADEAKLAPALAEQPWIASVSCLFSGQGGSEGGQGTLGGQGEAKATPTSPKPLEHL